MLRIAAVLALAAVLPAWADLSTAKSEPNLEKRARRALENAESSLKSAESAYLEKGDLKQTDAALQELSESVQLAYDSLVKTGKNPSRSPKHFKQAEIKTRELLRRLTDFRDQMSALDRDRTDNVIATIQKVHDDLLAGIMGEKKIP